MLPKVEVSARQRSDACIELLSVTVKTASSKNANEAVQLSLYLLENRDGANRAAGSTTDLEREADEAETATSNEFVEIEQTFHVSDTAFAANLMSAEIQLAFGGRADCLHAEHADALVRQPRHRLQRQ